MQINETKIGWLRKRVQVSCTLLATDTTSLQRELDAFKEQLHESVDHYGQLCSTIDLVVASGLTSTRAERPAMSDLLKNDPDLKAMARKCKVRVSFLNRMGDREGKFRVAP